MIQKYRTITLGDNFNVFIGDELVVLPEIEYAILKVLMNHPNQYLSHAEIYRKVWGGTPDRDVRCTIAYYIRKIRDKIEIDPRKPKYIITRPKYGFLYDEVAHLKVQLIKNQLCR